MEAKVGSQKAKAVGIRRAGSSDLEDMRRLLRELFAIETQFDAEPEKQRRGLMRLLESPTAEVWVAERGERIVGMVTVQLLVSTAEGGASGLLEDLIVTSAHRRKGFGKALVEAATQWARGQGATRIQLLADAHNVPAIIFYRKQDWKQTHMVALRRAV